MKVRARDKTLRFIGLLQQLLDRIQTTADLRIHHEINESIYMQKIEELKFLRAQLSDAEERVQDVRRRLFIHYSNAFRVWKRDVRWLNDYMRNTAR